MSNHLKRMCIFSLQSINKTTTKYYPININLWSTNINIKTINVIIEFLNIRVYLWPVLKYRDIKFNRSLLEERREEKKEEKEREREAQASRALRDVHAFTNRELAHTIVDARVVVRVRASLYTHGSLAGFPQGSTSAPGRSVERLPREGCDTRDTSPPGHHPAATNRGNTTSRESLTSCASHRISAPGPAPARVCGSRLYGGLHGKPYATPCLVFFSTMPLSRKYFL